MNDVLVRILLEATVLLAVVAVVALSLRRASAAARHWAWTCGLVGLLLVPALAAAPRWHLPFPWPMAAVQVPLPTQNNVAPVSPAIAQTPGPAAMTHVASDAPPAMAPEHPEPSAVSGVVAARSAPALSGDVTRTALLVAWLAGSLLALAAIGVALIRLKQLRRRCTPITTGPILDAARQLATELGLRRTPWVLHSAERSIPMAWGILRPTVLLPADAVDWSADRLRVVLLHELGHIARRDCLTHLLGHVARCLYWFHPLAWLALAQQRREQEKACDDLVLAHGARADEYAEHLLALTTRLPSSQAAASVALGMARTSRLRDRLTSLLDPARRRTSSRSRRLAWTVLALGALAPAATATWTPKPDRQPMAPEQMDVVAALDDQAPMTPDLLKKLEEIRNKLRENYVGPIDDKQLAEAAIKGLLQGLKDPYTDYLPPEGLTELDMQLKGSFFGIGAQLKMAGDRIAVATPLDNSPALKAGLRPGDVIDAIDGKSTRGETLPAAVKRIIGANGTIVKLKIIREDGAVEDVSVTRGPIRVATIQGFLREPNGGWRHMLDRDQKIGYVRITQFSPGTAKEVRAAVESLTKDGLKGLIVDLRSCPGGMLDQALAVCKLFVKEGLLLTVKGPGKQESSYRADGKETLGDFPMIVLINEQTASSAELTAGVLRDHGRAVLVGSRTFGKGSVSQIVKLDDGGALRVTSAFYLLPSGKMIHKTSGEKTWGVDPDDGYYLPITHVQADALIKNQASRFALGRKDNGAQPPARLTPKVIEEQYADPQLAAAARSLVARLTGGEFLKVGQSTAQMQQQMDRLEEMRRRREALLQELKRLESEIDAAQTKK